MELKINRLQHVGLPVTDIRRSVAFYESLGFRDSMSREFIHQGETVRVAMMEKSGVVMELYQLGPADLEEIRTRRNGHIDHVAFDVDDIDATYKLLKENGFTPLEPEPVELPFFERGMKFFFILGPDGERLEFSQIL